MLIPSVDKIKEYAQDYKYVPVKKEIYSDIKTPIEVLRILKGQSTHVYMLESVENQENWGRYTFLGYKPSMCITCNNGELSVIDDQGNVLHSEKIDHPAKYIKQVIEEHKSPKIEDFPTFTGGLVGYFAYDYIKYSEPKLNLDADDEEHFRDVDLMLFELSDYIITLSIVIHHADVYGAKLNICMGIPES